MTLDLLTRGVHLYLSHAPPVGDSKGLEQKWTNDDKEGKADKLHAVTTIICPTVRWTPKTWFVEEQPPALVRAIQCAVVDAFAAEPFKGNPAAVCLLEEDAAAPAEKLWMQSVAAEFSLSETAFLVRDCSSAGDASAPRFHLCWFAPVAEVELCGHATLASAHFLFTAVLAKHDMVEFATKSGILTAKKVPAPENVGVSGEEEPGKLFIELDFPMIDLVKCNSAELPSISETLNGANIVSVHKSATAGDIIDATTKCRLYKLSVKMEN